MAHLREYRAFTPEFCGYMHRHSGWPEDAATMSWFLNQGYAKDRTYLSALRGGRYAPEPYAYRFIEMLLSGATNQQLAKASRVLVKFLKEHGFNGPQKVASIESVLSHTCTPVCTDPPGVKPRREVIIDGIRRGFQDIASLAPAAYLRFAVSGVSGRDTVEEAVEWIYVRLAQDRLELGPQLDIQAAKEAATDIIGISFADYVARAEAWVAAAPWSVVFAKGVRRKLSVSVILPISEEAYGSILANERASYDITAADIRCPAQYFVFEALAENPRIARKPRRDMGKLMAMSLAAQHGALMRYLPGGNVSRYHFLAPSGTQENRSRMVASGWKATGVRAESHGHEYWEKTVDFSTGENTNPLEAATLAMLAKLCGPAPRPAP